MDHEVPDQALDASFDIVARQDAADQALGALRSDVEEVKGRLDRAARQARPDLSGAGTVSPELKGFEIGRASCRERV